MNKEHDPMPSGDFITICAVWIVIGSFFGVATGGIVFCIGTVVTGMIIEHVRNKKYWDNLREERSREENN